MAGIEEIEYIHVRIPLRAPFETSFGRFTHRESLIVRVRAGDFEGYGEIPVDQGPWYSYETVATALHISLDHISKALLGLEPTGLEDVTAALAGIRGHRMAKAGHEMAIADLLARERGIPLYRLIGGARREVEVGVSIGVIGDARELVRQVSRFLDEGYRRVKIKIKPGWDVEAVKLLRREFGEIPLQVDANASYSYRRHRGVLLELDGYGLLMIEQPFHYDDLAEHAAMQRELRTPICLDESVKGLQDAMAAIEMGSCRVINVKPCRVGGLLETKAINDYAKGRGVPIWIGGMLESGVGRAHLVAAATLDNVGYPCDISSSSRYFEEDVVEPPWTAEKGIMRPLERPGIGVEVLEERLRRYCVRRYVVRRW